MHRRELRHSQPTTHWAWALLDVHDTRGHVWGLEKGMTAAVGYVGMIFPISFSLQCEEVLRTVRFNP